MHSEINCLGRSKLFQPLSTTEKEHIVSVSSHRNYYPKGSLIKQPYDNSDGLIVIDEGMIKIYQLDDKGKESITGLLLPDDVYGQQYLFTSDVDSSTYLESIEDTWVCTIRRDDFQSLLKDNPDVSLALLNNFGELLIRYEKIEEMRSLMSSKERILAYLTDMSEQLNSNPFILPTKKKEIANLLNLTPETFSRKLKELQTEGFIRIHNKNVTLLRST